MFNFFRNLFSKSKKTEPVTQECQVEKPEPVVEKAHKTSRVEKVFNQLTCDCDYRVSRYINKVVVHCAATRKGRDDHIDAAEIRRWHVEENKWRDIGYHFVIKRDGTVEYGRNLNVAGAHVAGHNANTIGICLIGGYDKSGKTNLPIDKLYTKQQIKSLKGVLQFLSVKVPGVGIVGHRDFPGVAKACPGFVVSSFDWR